MTCFSLLDAAWATSHPWAGKKPGLEGFVMIYTPASKDEFAVVFQLVMERYNNVTGMDAATTAE
ncbi:MAG: hypothetical protein V3U65_15515 [Granulosicoccaceae bacterium]